MANGTATGILDRIIGFFALVVLIAILLAIFISDNAASTFVTHVGDGIAAVIRAIVNVVQRSTAA